MLAPVFSILWVRLSDRQPSSPVKFTLGMLFIGLAYFLMIPAAALTAQGRVSLWWLVGLYFLEVVGEMCLSPVGLSTVTKLSPPKLVGIMMGVWFLAASFGSKLAGYLSGFFVSNNSWQLTKLYGGIAIGLLVATVDPCVTHADDQTIDGTRQLRSTDRSLASRQRQQAPRQLLKSASYKTLTRIARRPRHVVPPKNASPVFKISAITASV